eukprot:g16176.t1
MAADSPPRTKAGLRDVVPGNYDALLIDQFGVLHDGNNIHQGVDDCLEKLSQLEPSVSLVMLSNSTKRATVTKERLIKKTRVDGTKFHDVITSGELVWRFFAEQGGFLGRAADAADKHRRKAFVIDVGDGYLHRWLDGIPEESLEIVPDIADADFVFAIGYGAVVGSRKCEVVRKLEFPFDLQQGATDASTHLDVHRLVDERLEQPSPSGEAAASGQVEHYRAEVAFVESFLASAASKSLPMLCVNPDLISAPRLDGTFDLTAGSLAKRYEDKFGGRCIYFGKPHKVMFDAALELLGSERFGGVGRDKKRIAMVGDSLLHDVRGAMTAGIDSIWCATGGVHYAELGLGRPGPVTRVEEFPPLERVDRVLALYEARPTWQVGGFAW